MALYLYTSHFFIFLFVVLLCSTLCVPVHASGNEGETGKINAELFDTKNKIDNLKGPDDVSDSSPKEITLNEIKPPFLLFAAEAGVMVAVAEAKYTKNDDRDGSQKFGVVAKYLKAKNKNKWDEEDIEKMGNNWNSQLATKEGDMINIFFTTRASVVNADGNKIYIFLLNITDDQKWNFKLVEGEVSGEEKNGKLITWSTKKNNTSGNN